MKVWRIIAFYIFAYVNLDSTYFRAFILACYAMCLNELLGDGGALRWGHPQGDLNRALGAAKIRKNIPWFPETPESRFLCIRRKLHSVSGMVKKNLTKLYHMFGLVMLTIKSL